MLNHMRFDIASQQFERGLIERHLFPILTWISSDQVQVWLLYSDETGIFLQNYVKYICYRWLGSLCGQFISSFGNGYAGLKRPRIPRWRVSITCTIRVLRNKKMQKYVLFLKQILWGLNTCNTMSRQYCDTSPSLCQTAHTVRLWWRDMSYIW